MGARTSIGLLTRRATNLVRMVDLISMCRHGPTERPQPFGNALWSLIPVVQHTLAHTLTRFNESAQQIGVKVGNIKVGESAVRARKGFLMIGKAYAAARVCWLEP
jgi:hypothetical protein